MASSTAPRYLHSPHLIGERVSLAHAAAHLSFFYMGRFEYVYIFLAHLLGPLGPETGQPSRNQIICLAQFDLAKNNLGVILSCRIGIIMEQTTQPLRYSDRIALVLRGLQCSSVRMRTSRSPDEQPPSYCTLGEARTA